MMDDQATRRVLIFLASNLRNRRNQLRRMDSKNEGSKVHAVMRFRVYDAAKSYLVSKQIYNEFKRVNTNE